MSNEPSPPPVHPIFGCGCAAALLLNFIADICIIYRLCTGTWLWPISP